MFMSWFDFSYIHFCCVEGVEGPRQTHRGRFWCSHVCRWGVPALFRQWCAPSYASIHRTENEQVDLNGGSLFCVELLWSFFLCRALRLRVRPPFTHTSWALTLHSVAFSHLLHARLCFFQIQYICKALFPLLSAVIVSIIAWIFACNARNYMLHLQFSNSRGVTVFVIKRCACVGLFGCKHKQYVQWNITQWNKCNISSYHLHIYFPLFW